MVQITVIAAFLAGLLSFFSPCVLPIIPGFLAYLSGVSLQKHSTKEHWRLFFNSVAFVLGFSSVFAILGVLLNTLLREVSIQVQSWLAKVGGVVIILFGLYLLGLFKPKFMEVEKKLKVKKKFSVSYITSFVFGTAFAVGWTPCIGPVLGSVLTLAVISPGESLALLLMYSLGLGIPFLLIGLFSDHAAKWIKKYGKGMKYFNIVVGVLLVILGVMVFTQTLLLFANFGYVVSVLGG
tara:strand:- start:10764 stop:11474 length:711 start_codon:yes stop_codon:yes gene_type:complete